MEATDLRVLAPSASARAQPASSRASPYLLALARKYGDARLEAGCVRALALGAKTRKSVASILAAGLDRQPTTATLFDDTVLPAHANVRGPEYYH